MLLVTRVCVLMGWGSEGGRRGFGDGLVRSGVTAGSVFVDKPACYMAVLMGR